MRDGGPAARGAMHAGLSGKRGPRTSGRIAAFSAGAIHPHPRCSTFTCVPPHTTEDNASTAMSTFGEEASKRHNTSGEGAPIRPHVSRAVAPLSSGLGRVTATSARKFLPMLAAPMSGIPNILFSNVQFSNNRSSSRAERAARFPFGVCLIGRVPGHNHSRLRTGPAFWPPTWVRCGKGGASTANTTISR